MIKQTIINALFAHGCPDSSVEAQRFFLDIKEILEVLHELTLHVALLDTTLLVTPSV